jgi:hypothetical protein
MKTYIWDSLKKKIATEAYSSISIFNVRAMTAVLMNENLATRPNWREDIQKLKDLVYERVMDWDIREAKKLIDLFPHNVTRFCKDKIPIAEYDENGRWILVFT